MRKTIAEIVSEASSVACWVYVQKYVKHKTLNEMLQELPDSRTAAAGGVRDFDDLALLRELGCDRLNVTIGSALDLFGGTMPFEKVTEYCRQQEKNRDSEKRSRQ